MTEDETGWSEKGRKSGRGQRPPREARTDDTSDSTTEATTPTRPSKRDTTATSSDDSAGTVVRRPASDGERKVARAAATAGQRDTSFASRLGFPALVALICLLGIGVVFYAWTTRDALASPRQNIDHWHAVYGVYDCTIAGDDKYLPQFLSSDDATGIHSHGDGIMHVHPFFELSSGDNAQMGIWFNEMRVELDEEAGRLTLDTGAELVEGTECADGSGPAELRILHWDFDFQALADEPPNEIHTEGLNEVKFDNDREVYIIAFAAADTEFRESNGNLPPAARFEQLNNVSAQLEYNPTELLPQDSGIEVEVQSDGDEGDGG